ncbi:MAG: peptidase M20, partial [Acidimicrobiales bacterium]|nr:peptidase M20 [Acidimicrobiales bacterium]
MGSDAEDRLVSSTWKPSVAVTGADGLPPVSRAGNVLRPLTRVKLAVRLPPTCDAARAADALGRALCTDPPYGAEVRFHLEAADDGWNAPAEPRWLAAALEEASSAAYGASAGRLGEGGSIPFISMLAHRFPGSDLVVTGVLGPGSNAHGPNEFLHLPMAQQLTAAMASLLDAHATRDRRA